jgi:hypothetical protein
MRRTPTALLVVAALAAGCGGSDNADQPAGIREGAVLYRDALANNDGGWLLDEHGHFAFADGAYQWRNIVAPNSPVVLPDKLLEHPIPAGLAVSVAVQVDKGEALRVVDCRELGPADAEPTDWYELGVDGRQAIIRRMAKTAPPKVLARHALSIPSGRRVTLTAHCVPAAKGGLVLALKVDGKPVVSAVDAKPLPAKRDGLAGTPAIRAYQRPDSPGPATVRWQDFEVRSASVG